MEGINITSDKLKTIVDMLETRPQPALTQHAYNGISIRELDAIPPGANPFNHDLYNMGTNIGKDITVMYSSCSNYMILVFNKTGRRIHLSFDAELTGS